MWNSKPSASSKSASNAFSNPTAAGLAARRSPTNRPLSPRSQVPPAPARSQDALSVIGQISASTTVIQSREKYQNRRTAHASPYNSPTEATVRHAIHAADSILRDSEDEQSKPQLHSESHSTGRNNDFEDNSIRPSDPDGINHDADAPSDSVAGSVGTPRANEPAVKPSTPVLTPATRRFEESTRKAVEELKMSSPRRRTANELDGANRSITSPQKSSLDMSPLNLKIVDTRGLLSSNASRDNTSNARFSSDQSVASNASSRRPLDLIHNDNAFHVIANIVLERVQRHDTGFDLDDDDWKVLDGSVPNALRENFIKAVRFRLKYNCPPTSSDPVHILTRQCGEYNLGKSGGENPLLRPPSSSSSSIVEASAKQTIDSIQTVGSIPQATSRSMSGLHQVNSFQNTSESVASAAPNSAHKVPSAPISPTKRPPLAPSSENDNKALRAQEDQHRRLRSRDVELHENTSVASVLTSPSIEQHQASTSESLARKQLMAELREASTLMAESQTPEAAEFWKSHVISLQARLRSLHNEDGPEDDRPISPPRRLVQSSPRTERHAVNIPGIADEELLSTPNYGPTNYGTEFFHPPIDRSEPSPRALSSAGYVQQHPIRTSPFHSSPSPGQTAENSEHPSPSVPSQSDQTSPLPDSSALSPEKSVVPTANGDLVVVMSPADLPAGYHFEAEIDGERFLATVPYGGVKKGETFSCAMRKLAPSGPFVPVGLWRDRLCDCFKFGACHPVNRITFFCPLVSLGQVMTRLKLDAFGRRTKIRVDTWSTMWAITSFWMTMNAFVFAAFCAKIAMSLPLSFADYLTFPVLNITGIVYSIYAVSKTRAITREMFNIQEYSFHDLEDNCCATFCLPCTICQLHRHTIPYDQFEARSCTKTGVNPSVRLDFIATSAGQ